MRSAARAGDSKPGLGALAGLGLAFAETEGDEAVRGVVGRNADLDPVSGNHPDPEAPHPARKLGRHGLTRLQDDLVAPAAENLLDGSGGLKPEPALTVALLGGEGNPVNKELRNDLSCLGNLSRQDRSRYCQVNDVAGRLC